MGLLLNTIEHYCRTQIQLSNNYLYPSMCTHKFKINSCTYHPNYKSWSL